MNRPFQAFVPLFGTEELAKRPKIQVNPAAGRKREPLSLEGSRLIEQVQSKDFEAYGRFVRLHQDRVFNTCWRICGNLEDARDLTQEAFLRGMQSLADFRGQSSLYTWVFRIAVNLALSHKRKGKTRQTLSLDWSPLAEGTQAAELAKRMHDARAETPEKATADAELQGEVIKALNALDADHRAVIVLRDIEGFGYREIAEILEVAPGTVKSRLHRARITLREAIKPYTARQ